MGETPNQGGGNKRKIQEVSLNEATMEKLAVKMAQKANKPRRTKNEWGSIFAFILLSGFLVIIGFIVFADQVWGEHTNTADLLTTVGTLISSPLSFVIGYYYNKEKGN